MNSHISLTIFCLDDQCTRESQVLKHPSVIESVSNLGFIFISRRFLKFGATGVAADVFGVVVFSGLINCFIRMKLLSLVFICWLVLIWNFLSILSVFWKAIPAISWFPPPLFGYYFSFFHFLMLPIFKTKMFFLWKTERFHFLIYLASLSSDWSVETTDKETWFNGIRKVKSFWFCCFQFCYKFYFLVSWLCFFLS